MSSRCASARESPPYEDIIEDGEWFEVVKGVVFIKAAPDKVSKNLGLITQGAKVQGRVVGGAWVELSANQLARFSETCEVADQGYALIDGTSLGLGPLLRGPLPESEWPDAQLPCQGAGTPPPPAGGKPGGNEAVEGSSTELDGDCAWFEVVKSVVFLKAEANKDGRNVGLMREGEKIQVLAEFVLDGAGHLWVELTKQQVARLGEGCEGAGGGASFALIDGTHLGLGPLLRGPLPPSEWPEIAARPTAFGFEVLDLEVPVLAAPSPLAAEIGRWPQARVLWLEEETFDGWAKLAHEVPTFQSPSAHPSRLEGWVRRSMRCEEGIVEFLRPVGGQSMMLPVMELSDEAGPRRFEVACHGRVPILAAPHSTAQAKGARAFSASLWAESQTYYGWVRLKDSEGWVRAWGPNAELLMHSPLFEGLAEWCSRCRAAGVRYVRSEEAGFGGTFKKEAYERLDRAVVGADPEALRDAIRRCRAAGLSGEAVRSAELRLDALRRGLQVAEAPRAAGSQPAPASDVAEQLASADGMHREALECLAVAAASGDAVAVREAADAARKAGVSKREIARVHALHSSADGAVGL